MDIMQYIIGEALILIPFLWVLAEVIKRTEMIANKWIPLILLGVSLVFSPWLLGGYTAPNLVQAVLVAGGEMIAYQVIDKTFRKQDYSSQTIGDHTVVVGDDGKIKIK